jgi:hypothetical protein
MRFFRKKEKEEESSEETKLQRICKDDPPEVREVLSSWTILHPLLMKAAIDLKQSLQKAEEAKEKGNLAVAQANYKQPAQLALFENNIEEFLELVEKWSGVSGERPTELILELEKQRPEIFKRVLKRAREYYQEDHQKEELGEKGG